jgi:AcrR family transcriptional regulator
MADLAEPRKGQRTRRRLLELAVARFAVDGYRGTSLSAVAREAGLTPAAAYAYFPSKEALFAAAVDADADALIHEALDRVGGGRPVREGLVLLLAELRAALERHPLARRVLAGREPEVTGRLLDLPALTALRETVTADLAAGVRIGTVRADVDPAGVALGLQTIALALLMAQLQVEVVADPAQQEVRIGAVLAVLDAALRPPP